MSLKLFEQFGFVTASDNLTQYSGNCIFCGKEKHFSMHKEKFLWDCKRCGRSGNPVSFLKQAVTLSQENFIKNIAAELSRLKSLKIKTLRKYGIGFINDQYILPFFDEEGSLTTIQTYNKKNNKLINLSGYPVSLFNRQGFAQRYKEIWLCEGAWDTMALDEILQKDDALLLGVTGAGTFKAEWVPLFKDKVVHVVFDNDEAGEKGQEKVCKMLGQIVRSLDCIKWPEGLKKGYDIRDSLIDGYTEQDVLKLLVNSISKEKKKKYNGVDVDLSMIYKTYTNWLHLSSTDVIDILFGTIIANRLDGDPLWMFLVAPPGGTKTEFIMSLGDCPEIFALSSLTPHSLISGFSIGGEDPSLIPKLNGKILAIKDFTNILNMNQTSRDEIFGILRDAYDGECAKPFGNNQYKFYRSKFGIIAGVTPVIDQHTEAQSALGERFLRYKIPIDTSIKGSRAYLKKASANVGSETAMRDDLKKVSLLVLEQEYSVLPFIDDALREKILLLAQFVGIMRGTVTRDRYSKEILHKPFTELGTRLTKQFTKLLYGICLFRHIDTATNIEYHVVRDVARSSVPSALENIVRFLYKTKKPQSTGEVSKHFNLPRMTCQRSLENLNVLDVLRKEEIGAGLGKFEWALADDVRELIEGSEMYL